MPSPLEQPPPPSGPVGQPGSASSPPPSLASLSGGGQPQPPDASIQIVTQHLMEAEQALAAAAQIKPELSGILSAFIASVKPQAGQILFGGGAGATAPMQPSLPPSPGAAGGMMGGMMTGGGAASAPAPQ